MCLAVTAKVISVKNNEGEVLIDGRERRVSFIALPNVVPGDYVLVSLGMALERITEEEAQDIDAAWDEIASIEVRERMNTSERE